MFSVPGFQEVVIKKLEKLEDIQNQILALLNSLVGGACNSTGSCKPPDFQLLPRFPLNTYPELCDFEKSLDGATRYDTAVIGQFKN